MHRALTAFNANIARARELAGLYDFLVATVTAPFDFDDILRAQIVYSVSAFDKLIHDLVRIGMVNIYAGRRPLTPKYHAENISIELHGVLASATIPPGEYLFEQAMIRKLKIMAFQDPDKVADGLSLVWNESQKWQKIALAMGIDVDSAKTKLKLIVGRRNAIVREADMDPIANSKIAFDSC